MGCFSRGLATVSVVALLGACGNADPPPALSYEPPASPSYAPPVVAAAPPAQVYVPPSAPTQPYAPAAPVAPSAPVERAIDPGGRWCFRDTVGREQRNIVTVQSGGIRVSPVGRQGSEVVYGEAGPNIYQDRSGATYEFYSGATGAWRGHGAVLPLRRCD